MIALLVVTVAYLGAGSLLSLTVGEPQQLRCVAID